ncbi:LOW QUALITY PROTEIN: hypothetical protein BSKO_04409 [Bryopsis sp. KO-2023]|nr:LOW QUALITY PROTEIN: hypothetical protein BSKO_04409 [Bryopsis sp. KO-2023]
MSTYSNRSSTCPLNGPRISLDTGCLASGVSSRRLITRTTMVSSAPPPPPGPSGTPPGKGQSSGSQLNQAAHEVFDFFGQDMGAGMVTLVLLLLGLMHAAMTRCTC